MAPINDVVFDGFSFIDNGIVITDLNYMEIAKRDNQLETRANRDGADLVQSLLGTKPIPLSGYYIGSSAIDAQNMYDTLAQALNRQERPLYIPHAGGTRKFIVTPENIIISEPDGLNRLVFSFQFIVPEGNSVSDTSILMVNQAVTSATATIPLTIQGSVKARPVVTIQYSAISGGTSGVVTLRNAKDFVGVAVSRNFVTGDTLTIDSENFQIFHNSTLLEPAGRFPTWDAGTGSLYYSDTFTTRTANLIGLYYPKNL